jgi:hypothetical protein
LSDAPPSDQHRIDLGDDLMRVLARTVSRLADEFGEAFGKQSHVALAGNDVVLFRPVKRERMAALVPGDPREVVGERRAIQAIESFTALVDQDHAQVGSR